MKKFLKQLGLVLLFINLALMLQMGMAFAAPVTPLKTIQSVGDPTQLPSFQTGQHPDAPPDYLQPGVGSLTSPVYFIIDFIRYLVSAIAVLIIIVNAIKLITTENEEEAGKIKKTLMVGVIGLIVIQLADVVVKKMFFGERGEAFTDVTTTQLYAEETVKITRGIIGFVELLIGAVAVLVIIIRGFVLLTSGGEEEKLTKAKNHIIYAVVGLLIVVLAEVVVRGVIFPAAGTQLPDTEKGKFIIVALTNWISGFVSTISFLMLFYGGYRYVVAGSEEETKGKVSKIILGAVIALVISLGAFAIVNTVIELKPIGDATTQSVETGQTN